MNWPSGVICASCASFLPKRSSKVSDGEGRACRARVMELARRKTPVRAVQQRFMRRLRNEMRTREKPRGVYHRRTTASARTPEVARLVLLYGWRTEKKILAELHFFLACRCGDCILQKVSLLLAF